MRMRMRMRTITIKTLNIFLLLIPINLAECCPLYQPTRPILTFYDYHPSTQSGWVDFGIDLPIDCLLRGYYQYGVPSLFRIGHNNETWGDCLPVLNNGSTQVIYGLPSSRIYANKGLYPDWYTNVKQTVELIKPLMMEGVVKGVFLGDEQICGGHQTGDQVEMVAETFRYYLGDSAIIYMNECAGADSSFTRGIPSSLSYYSVDIYDKGIQEVIRVREYYEKNIFPKLQNNTKVFIVPGIFGNPTQPIKPQQELLLQKLESYREWVNNETRIAGINPWHYSHRTNIKYPNDTYPYGLGVVDFPKVLHRLRKYWGKDKQICYAGNC